MAIKKEILDKLLKDKDPKAIFPLKVTVRNKAVYLTIGVNA